MTDSLRYKTNEFRRRFDEDPEFRQLYLGFAQERTAKATATKRAKADEALDDAEFLMEDGMGVYQVAEALGTTIGALGRRARRRGRADLAKPFERQTWAERKAA